MVVTAKHPRGLVDGIVLAELISRVRTDYKILTRSLLTGVEAIDELMIPGPFQHDPYARTKNLEMRRRAMKHLEAGGAIALFPSGAVSSSDTWFGPAIEREWNAFTAMMITRSGATVVPIRLRRQNSRDCQIASNISATDRQGLLLHGVRRALGQPQCPVVADPIPQTDLSAAVGDPKIFMQDSRARTLSLHAEAPT